MTVHRQFGANFLTEFVEPLRELTPAQRNAYLACFLGWTLDAFDFFLLVFVMQQVAAEFGKQVADVAVALQWTLAMRPVGALFFGLLADRCGRRMALMLTVVFYSVMEFLCGFAPSLNALIVLRALYGVGMGGEWGVGASLAMESLPPRSRGVLSGLLQQGYVVGNMLAAAAFCLVCPWLGWRWMFFLGIIPAGVVFFIRSHVEESEAWRQTRRSEVGLVETLIANWKTFLYLVLLMTAFNSMSHGTQDLYPTFLGAQRGLSPGWISAVAIIGNFGAIFGGVFFGALSQRIGRRRAIMAAALLGLPLVPLWMFSSSLGALATGAFLMQFMVQGAWGVIPVHLNELSPAAVRGTFPGFTYQLGNLFASHNGVVQAQLAKRWGGNYAMSLGVTTAVVLLAVAGVTALGREATGVSFVEEPEAETAAS